MDRFTINLICDIRDSIAGLNQLLRKAHEAHLTSMETNQFVLGVNREGRFADGAFYIVAQLKTFRNEPVEHWSDVFDQLPGCPSYHKGLE